MRTIIKMIILYFKGYRYFTPCVHKLIDVTYCIHKNSKVKEDYPDSNKIQLFSIKGFEIIEKNLVEEYLE